MKTEQIAISFVAVLIGILVAGTSFLIYQNKLGRPFSPSTPPIVKDILTPTSPPNSTVLLTITQPEEEAIVTTKTIIVKGTTAPNATVIVSNEIEDHVTHASDNGSFSVSITIEDGLNLMSVTAISQTGEEVQKKLTVSYTTETF